MKKLMCNACYLSLLLLATAFSSKAQHDTSLPIEGRWDLTINGNNGRQSPSWLEVEMSGNQALVGRFVGAGGSARPIAKVNYKKNQFDFTIPPQWEQGSDM